jgi:hypothetical protein
MSATQPCTVTHMHLPHTERVEALEDEIENSCMCLWLIVARHGDAMPAH